MKRKQPETSREAYLALTNEKLSKDYSDIIEALKVIGTGTYEEIALFYGWQDINKCSRRLKELELKGLLFKTGTKRLTKRNRSAFVYQLTGSQPKTEIQQNKSVKNSDNHIKELINAQQPTLF